MNKAHSSNLLGEAEAAQRLQACDILPTQQRVQIARVLLARDQHLSADQVLELLYTNGGAVSKATLYNTLGLFAEKGLVREVTVDPSRVLYDTNISKHYHFYNIETGELSDIDPAMVSMNQLPAAPPGTSIDGVDVVIRVRKSGPHWRG
jgi:Fur family iron response transcriptional regulator